MGGNQNHKTSFSILFLVIYKDQLYIKWNTLLDYHLLNPLNFPEHANDLNFIFSNLEIGDEFANFKK